MAKKVVFFVSRRKDNLNVAGFKPRNRGFLVDTDDFDAEKAFTRFVEEGVLGEASRYYVSVNTPDMKKVKKALLTKLINDDDEEDLLHVDRMVTSLAAKEENALNRNWLFDVDTPNPLALSEFRNDLIMAIRDSLGDDFDLDYHPILYTDTPHGGAFVTTFHFDTRSLLAKWGEVVTLKKGAALFMAIRRKMDVEEELEDVNERFNREKIVGTDK